MGWLARRGFVFMLAMALIAGGLPLAHAMPCASSTQPSEIAHQHVGMQMAMAGDHIHDGSQASSQPHRHDGQGPVALDVCKCLNCGMCATGYAAPLLGAITPERRAFAVSYLPASTGLPAALTFVDPGIPIAMV
jgi:hypothetical protein